MALISFHKYVHRYAKIPQVFSGGLESDIVNYLLRALNIYFDLKPTELRKLANKVGEGNKLMY